ncbi:hypothetical protein [Stagnihabitans tardus]|uniref:Uncharacterized protein n=1 Tax=Stagnihabitans tardus TaxID=2699202 RepID=A0AAE4YCU7_9RHOB|nr:hypothetical protein [Stagnihabitans tardus]NBZ87914.1 hypothetical protein [Stagnihabitans tardus]
MIVVNGDAVGAEFPTVLFDNALASATLSGATVSAGAARENVLGPQTFDYWEPITQTGVLTATWAAPIQLDMVAIAAHNLHLTGANLRVHAAPDLVAVTSNITVFAAADLAANGAGPLAVVFGSRTVQKLSFTCTAGPGAPLPRIGIIYAGQRLAIPGGIAPPYVQAEDARKVETNAAQSLGGHYLRGMARRKAMRQTAQISAVERAWADGALQPFRAAYDMGAPFFWAGSPAFLTRDLSYAWRPDDAPELRPQVLAGGARVGLTLELAGYGG